MAQASAALKNREFGANKCGVRLVTIRKHFDSSMFFLAFTAL